MRVRTYSDLVRDAAALSNMMNRVFDRGDYDYARNGGSDQQPAAGEASLPIDVWANADTFQVQAYVPGVNPDEVEITFEGDELTIRGKLPELAQGGDFVKRELFHGTFTRRLTFNVPVDVERIEASFHNGLLTLTVPKAEAVRPKQIKIQTK